MMTAREIERYDIERRAMLNQHARRFRDQNRVRLNDTIHGGKLTAQLPKNWEAIKATVEANIDRTMATTDRDREAVLACVGFTVGITQRAIAGALGIKRGSAGVHVSRMNRGRAKWLAEETERIAKLCPAPVFVEEGKAR